MKHYFTVVNEWEGGKPSGSISFLKEKSYFVRFTDGTYKTFNIDKYKNAKKEATEYKIQQSLNKGLTRNQFRLIECDLEGKYYEVQLQDEFTGKINIDDLQLFKQYTWYAHKGCNNRCYMYSTISKTKKIIFHSKLFPHYKEVDHINRDGLDNRKQNLRDGGLNINKHNQGKRTDNSSGKVGVHFSKYNNKTLMTSINFHHLTRNIIMISHSM